MDKATRHCADCFYYHPDDESWGRCTRHGESSVRKGEHPTCCDYHEAGTARQHNDDVNMMSRTDVRGGE